MALASHKTVLNFGLPLSSFSPLSTSFVRNPLKRPRTEDPTFSSSHRFRFQMTWSATKPSPLDHLTFLRRCNVQVFRSSLGCQPSSKYGRVMLSASVRVKYSLHCRTTFES